MSTFPSINALDVLIFTQLRKLIDEQGRFVPLLLAGDGLSNPDIYLSFTRWREDVDRLHRLVDAF